MRRRNREVLEVPVLRCHLETLELIANVRGLSISQLASEIIAAGLISQKKLVKAMGRPQPESNDKSGQHLTQSTANKTRILRKKRMRLLQSIGMAIKARRLELGLSQVDLGRKCGLSRTLIVDIEGGGRAVGLDCLYLIANALDVDGSSLVHQAEIYDFDDFAVSSPTPVNMSP